MARLDSAVIAILKTDETVTKDQVSRIQAILNGEQKPTPRLLTMKEAASRFGCTVRTVQRWCLEGELQTIKRGRLVRIPEESLYAMTAAGGVK
jgi:excisionase family DNA binding protein